MYTRSRGSWMRYIDFIFVDFFCMELAFILGFMLRHGISNPFAIPIYQQMGILIALIQIVVGVFLDSYQDVLRRGYFNELKKVVSHTFFCLGGIFAYMFIMHLSGQYSRTVLLGTCFYGIVFIFMGRTIWKSIVEYLLIKRGDFRSVMIVSKKNNIENCLKVLESHRYVAYKISSIVIIDENCIGRFIHDIPVVASGDTIMQSLKTTVVDEVFLNIYEETELMENLTKHFLEVGVTVHQALAKITKTSINERIIENFGGYVVASSSIKIATPRQMLIKRILDIIGGLIGLIFIAVIYILLYPFILIQSPGSILFSQTRVGKNGRQFKIYKFRTMYMDAEERKAELMEQNEMGGLMFKIKNDPRIIPIGKLLRRTSIDELPQLWNVLKGDMSLVGTRPPTLDEWEQYELKDMKRLSIKPGLTGLWQVSGRNDIVDFEEVVALDTKYITEWSLSLDIKILFKTIKVVLFQEGR